MHARKINKCDLHQLETSEFYDFLSKNSVDSLLSIRRSELLKILYRAAVLDPDKTLNTALRMPSPPRPLILALKIHLGQSVSIERFSGNDLLVSVASALKLKNTKKAQKFLNKYYLYHKIPSPNVISRYGQFSIGGDITYSRKISSVHKVSVILTTFNESNYVENAIKSILAQTWGNIELLIVDDGSTDDTLKKVSKFRSDSRITVIPLGENKGTYCARNIGLCYSSGSFISFQDADDWSHPYRIERQVTPLIKIKALQATLSKFFRVNEQSGLPYSVRVYPLHRLNPSSLLFRRCLLDKIGEFDQQTKVGADSEFIERIQIFYGAKSILKIKTPLSIGLQRTNSLTSNSATGIDVNGRSVIRENYEFAYRCKHKKLVENKINYSSDRLSIHLTRKLFIYFINTKNFIKWLFDKTRIQKS